MTDGMAKWFQKRCAGGEAPFDTLWNLSGMDGFRALAEEARKGYEMDDDLAVILVRIAGSPEGDGPADVNLFGRKWKNSHTI